MSKWFLLAINSLLILINVPYALEGSVVNIIAIAFVAVMTVFSFALAHEMERW